MEIVNKYFTKFSELLIGAEKEAERCMTLLWLQNA